MSVIDAVLSLMLLCGPVPSAPPQPRPPKDPMLRAELLKRVRVDQGARRAWIAWLQKQGSYRVPLKTIPPIARRMSRVDADNRNWLKAVIARHGWPGIGLVGKDGANAAWLLVQHADADRAFQKRCLMLMTNAAARGDASKTELAYLVDRVLVGQHKKQRYGTQTTIAGGEIEVDPIEDEANVDRRRAAMGMQPLAKYLRIVREMYLGKEPANAKRAAGESGGDGRRPAR